MMGKDLGTVQQACATTLTELRLSDFVIWLEAAEVLVPALSSCSALTSVECADMQFQPAGKDEDLNAGGFEG